MSETPPPFTPDAPQTTPEGLITEMIQNGVTGTLGERKNTLYIQQRNVGEYHIDDWKIYIWSDSRGRENSVFISPGYVSAAGNNHQVSWYRTRKEVAKTIMKIPNQRDFIERCVLGEVTPENLQKKYE